MTKVSKNLKKKNPSASKNELGAFKLFSGRVPIALEGWPIAEEKVTIEPDYICLNCVKPSIFEGMGEDRKPDYYSFGDMTRFYFNGADITPLVLSLGDDLHSMVFESYPKYLFSGMYADPDAGLADLIKKEIPARLLFNADLGYRVSGGAKRRVVVEGASIILDIIAVELKHKNMYSEREVVHASIPQQIWIDGVPVFGNDAEFTREYQFELWEHLLAYVYNGAHEIWQDANAQKPPTGGRVILKRSIISEENISPAFLPNPIKPSPIK